LEEIQAEHRLPELAPKNTYRETDAWIYRYAIFSSDIFGVATESL
jgi:hypothetical protein